MLVVMLMSERRKVCVQMVSAGRTVIMLVFMFVTVAVFVTVQAAVALGRFFLKLRAIQHPQTDRHDQHGTDRLQPEFHAVDVALSGSHDGILSRVHDKGDADQRDGMADGAGEAHQHRMQKTASLFCEINQHCRLAVSRFERMNGAQKKGNA